MKSCDGLLAMLLVATKDLSGQIARVNENLTSLNAQQRKLEKMIHEGSIENEQVRWAICAVVHVLYLDYLSAHPDSLGHGGKRRQTRREATEFNQTYFEDVGQDLSAVRSILKKLAEGYEWSASLVTPSPRSGPLGGATLKL